MKKFKLRVSLTSYRNKLIVAVICLLIGVSSLLFTAKMVSDMREKEKSEMSLWSYAMSRVGEVNSGDPLVLHIVNNQKIPFILTDDRGHVEESHMISDRILEHPSLLKSQMMKLSEQNQPLEINAWNGRRYVLFYGYSRLLKALIYFPIIQIIVFALFIALGFLVFRSSKQDEQNRVWIGLAKETAHQLGTPISSLLGWIEYLRSMEVDEYAVQEMDKDLTRLMKVADRFSKIGSETILSTGSINEVVGSCVLYFQTRIPKNVTLTYNGLAIAPLQAAINAALFEWVIENLLKNALDAMQGQGEIDVNISSNDDWVYIDVKDSGKGIAKANIKNIFEPGFTTKTRGWGLGLSLSRRIVEEYHNGKISVLESEVGVGTTIRVAVKRIYS